MEIIIAAAVGRPDTPLAARIVRTVCGLLLIGVIGVLGVMWLTHFNLRENVDLVMPFKNLFLIVPLFLSLPIAHFVNSNQKKHGKVIAGLLILSCPVVVFALFWSVLMQSGLGSPEIPYPSQKYLSN